MSWLVVARAEVEAELAEAAVWYEEKREGLGMDFIQAFATVRESLGENPLLASRRDPTRPVRWKMTRRFPFRVIYEVLATEKIVTIIAVMHTARHDRHWKRRGH